jgi:hypothetical protein
VPRRAHNAHGGISEHVWQQRVLGLARFYDWRAYHPPDNAPMVGGRGARRQRVEPGFPDLHLLRGPELLIVELKDATGRTTAAQEAWLDAYRVLAAAVKGAADPIRAVTRGAPEFYLAVPSVEVHVWRPADADAAHERLARGRARVPAAWEGTGG